MACLAHQHIAARRRRIIFAIPYEGAFTLIGTTDVEQPQEAIAGFALAKISSADIDYLCEQASRYFKAPVRPDEVVWS